MTNHNLDTKFGGDSEDSDDGESTTEVETSVSSFLTDSETVEGLSFPLASGANWTKAAAGLVGGTITAIVLGIQSFAQNVLDALASVVNGIGDFSGSLVTVIGNDASEAITGAFDVALPSFGVFAPLVAIAVTLAAFYVITQGPRLVEVLR